MIGMMADAVMKQMVPGGEADVVYLVGEKGARIEYMQSAMGQPAGTITIFSPDGNSLGPESRKKKPTGKRACNRRSTGMKASGIPTPEVTAKRTGQFDTIAGDQVRGRDVRLEDESAHP